MAVLLLDTDHTVLLPGLKDQDGTPVTGATVTAVLLDKNFNATPGAPFPLTFIDAGGGNYTASIGDDNTLDLGTTYQVKYVAEKGGIKRTWFDQLSVDRGKF